MKKIKSKGNRTHLMFNKFVVFIKAQVSAFLGGIVDYMMMIFFTEIVHLHYTVSIVIGGVIGSLINFSLNKKWTFHVENNPYKNSLNIQMLKFIAVVMNSIFLKSTGTYLLTQYLSVDYRISRIVIDLIVSLMFNYTLQKYWVFRKTRKVELRNEYL